MSRFLSGLQQQNETPEEKPEETPGQNLLAPPIESDEEDGKKKGAKKNKKKGKKEEGPGAVAAPTEPAKEAVPAKPAQPAKEVPQAKPTPAVPAKDDKKPETTTTTATDSTPKDEDAEDGDEGDEKDEPGKAASGAAKKKKEKKKPISKAAQMAAEKIQKKKDEEELIKRMEEEAKRKEEEEKRKKEEEERLRKEEEERLAAEKEAELARKKELGLHMSKAERKRKQAQEKAREQLLYTIQSYGQKQTEHGLEAVDSPDPLEGVKVERKQSRAEKKAEEKAHQVLAEVHLPKKKSEKIEEGDHDHHHKEGHKNATTEEAQGGEELEDWEKLINIEEAEKATKELEAKNSQSSNSPKKVNKGKPKAQKKGGEKEGEAAKPGEDFGEIEEEMNPEEQEKIYSSAKEAFYVKSRFRCPIICILGHVDTGKTKILDKIRRTNVQCGEEGGITQQIGASFFPQYKLKEEIAKLDGVYKKIDVEIPGLLIIDTPGHESFANLRQRGESLCDFAILVVDVKHGLENQTIESLNMLKEKGTPFIVALNKIDILAQWKPTPDGSSLASLKKQEGYTQNLYDQYFNRNQNDFAQQGILIQNYWENVDRKYNQSVVPTSAHTGEGIPDLLGYITEFCQTELEEKITPKDAFNCTVMEVKKIDGLGTTIDVVLLDGTLKEGDKIILSGFEGPIETTIRALLTPQPLKELRVKADYIHHSELRGAMGCKIAAPGLEKAIAGTSMYRYDDDDELPDLRDLLSDDIQRVRKMVKFKNEGVGVIASTLGSLEALLLFLKTEKIPVSNVSIGDITKEDVMKSQNALLLEDERKRRKEYATILAFDVKALPDAEAYAKKTGVHIIQAKIIYHLCDEYKKWVTICQNERKEQSRKEAVFPCVLKPIAFFNKKDPIVIGCDVVEGVLKLNTPVCVFKQGEKGMEKVVLGVVQSIEANHKPINEARLATGNIAISIKGPKDTNYTAGRTFDLEDQLISNISRKSLDCLLDNFRDEMDEDGWNLVRKLKPKFGII